MLFLYSIGHFPETISIDPLQGLCTETLSRDPFLLGPSIIAGSRRIYLLVGATVLACIAGWAYTEARCSAGVLSYRTRLGNLSPISSQIKEMSQYTDLHWKRRSRERQENVRTGVCM